jgi:hypothetical protein
MKMLFVLALVISGHLLNAQSQLGTGAVTGVVADASGKSIAMAVIQVINSDTGLTRQTTSSGTGDFSIPVLPTLTSHRLCRSRNAAPTVERWSTRFSSLRTQQGRRTAPEQLRT